VNPVGEEAGKTSRAVVDALKGNPAVLALTIANMALLVFMFYALHGAAKYRETLTTQVLDNSRTIQEMLKQRAVACPP
jgi:hypothetical protein